MAFVTLYRFRIDISDVDRSFYERLDFRAALHPSEAPIYLVTRVLAYALNFQEGLAFSSGGLSDPDAPALKVEGAGGEITLWVEIGNPSARKLHKASKASREVKVYTYKDAKLILQEIEKEKVHEAERIEIYSFKNSFLEKLVASLEKDNTWTLLRNENSLVLNFSQNQVAECEMKRHFVGGKL